MRKLLLPLFIMFSLTGMSAGLNSALVIPPVSPTNQISINHVPQLGTLKVKDIEKKLGRKLSIKEKIAFFIIKKSNAEKNPGKTALIFGIVGAALLLIGLFVPYVILGSLAAAIVAVVIGSGAKKQNPDDKRARAATLLGWITLGAIALLVILAAIVIAAWGGAIF